MSSKSTILAALAAILLTLPAFAAAATCGETCPSGLRGCLQTGRPDLRACLSQCREAAGSACPDGVDIEDCPDATEFQACVAGCRDARRKEIRRCVQVSMQCAKECRPAGPTPTATPR